MEATAIATALAGVEMPRPMTHDLFTGVLGELGATLQRVTVTDLIEGTFYAEISLADSAGHSYTVDARPSDSIAMALRSGAAIYVARAVLEEAGGLVEEEEGGEGEAQGNAEQPPVETPTEVAARAGAALEGDRQVPPMLDSDVRLEDLDPELFGKYKM
jgi:bifunctional DNase/RNase